MKVGSVFLFLFGFACIFGMEVKAASTEVEHAAKTNLSVQDLQFQHQRELAEVSNHDRMVSVFDFSSTQEKRLLNTCETFKYDGVGDWKVDGTGDTLADYCTANACCKTGTTGNVNGHSNFAE